MEPSLIRVMCANDGEADQVRCLLDLLHPVMGLPTREERFEKYQETWARLNPAAEKEEWKVHMAVNFPWSGGKVDLWRTLRREMHTKFQTALSEHLNGESTDRPIQPFCFMDYSEMLLLLLDQYLTGLDKYIAIQDRISAVSANMHACDEDERPMSEKSMHASARRRAQDFLDVLLFLHAVPQREPGRWDALDLASDVTWFRAHAEVYQNNAPLMAFLRDCAVVVLVTGCFDVPKDVKSIHNCYVAYKGCGL